MGSHVAELIWYWPHLIGQWIENQMVVFWFTFKATLIKLGTLYAASFTINFERWWSGACMAVIDLIAKVTKI